MPKAIDYKKLTRSGQIDFEIWQHELKKEIWLADNTDRFANDPRVFNEFITESVYSLLTQSTLPQPVNVRNAIARMAQIPKIVRAAKESIKNPPKVLTEVAIKQNRGAIAFYERGIFELAGEDAMSSDLKNASKTLVPILREHQKFLEEDVLPRSTGEWRLGKEKFAEKMLLELDAGVTAAEVLKEAEDAADRVENEMYVIARQLWKQVFPKRVLPVDDEKGRRETIRLVLEETSKEHGKADDLIIDAKAGVAKINAFIKAKDILRLPDPDRCKIIEMPEFQRGYSIAYLNPAPPMDAKAASYYAISPPPSSWEPARVRELHGGIQSPHPANPHDPRSLSGPLRAARIRQSPSFLDPQDLFIGRFRRGLGGLCREGDARRRLRRRRPEAAAQPAQVVSAGPSATRSSITRCTAPTSATRTRSAS